MKNGKGQSGNDDFIAPARQTFWHVARQIRSEHAKYLLPHCFGKTGKLRLASFVLNSDLLAGWINSSIVLENDSFAESKTVTGCND